MKTQSISASFSGVKNGLNKFSQLITWSNIWKLINLSIFILGIIFCLWIVFSILGMCLIAAWAIFGSTSFSGDDMLTQISVSLWRSTTFEKLLIVALAINSINRIVKMVKAEEIVGKTINKITDFFEE